MLDPTLQELAKQSADTAQGLGQLTISANLVWTCVTGFLVMFMQAGFALVETGLTRSKNVAHTMAMNFLVYSIGVIGFWAIGFGLQMGGVGALGTFGNETTLSQELVVQVGGKPWGLFGTTGFFLPVAMFTPGVAALFLFQMVFMDTTATIPTGAAAERWKFASFVAFSFVISTLIYPIYANWVWGGGWLSALGRNYGLGHGHVDFAGSSVVHMTGGVAALACAKLLGPRIGKYNPDGSPNPIPGHNIPMAVLGTFILAFGWFGFNPGSTLAGTDLRIGVVATNTMLASAAGAIVAMFYAKIKFGKPDPTWFSNGTYGEGFNGVPGTVRGLFYGDSGQFFAGLIGIGVNVAYVGATAAIALLVVGRLLGGNRVSREVELAGLDVPEMGVDGYVGDPGISLPDESAGSSRAFFSTQAAGGE